MIDYYRAGNDAPRIAKAIKVLEDITPGELFGSKSLREHIMMRSDLADRTVQNLIYDATHCESPILRKIGNGRQTRYARIKD
jgi:hypothetical protein